MGEAERQIENRKRVACIGTRNIDDDERVILERIGAHLVSRGYLVSTGNAIGSDQAFARGGNSIDPRHVELWLPWKRYERGSVVPGNTVHDHPLNRESYDIAGMHHSLWHTLNHGVKRLMARNVDIVRGCILVIALPGKNKMGGTGHGMRVSKGLGIPVRNIRNKDEMNRVLRQMES